jgi:prohibitin 2
MAMTQFLEQKTKGGGGFSLPSGVGTGTQEVFKSVTALYTAPDLIGRRAEVSIKIRDGLEKKLSLYGAHVINVDMRNFSFQQAYMDAINEKVRQEQLKLAAINKAGTPSKQSNE